tara:strand:+ start:60 stop:218 length:159 start_codon:yes stop_codon:yes gene_type:complete
LIPPFVGSNPIISGGSMMELVDMLVLGTSSNKRMKVQILLLSQKDVTLSKKN